MNNLFWADCPAKNDLPWAMERVNRCETEVAETTGQLAIVDLASVIDFGLTTRAKREGWLVRAQAARVGLALHLLEPRRRCAGVGWNSGTPRLTAGLCSW